LIDQRLLTTLKAAVIAGAVVVLGISLLPKSGRADNDYNAITDEKLMVQVGLKMAPVPLNMGNRDPDSVGLGSFLVNFLSDCNGCHTSDPSLEYTGPGNLYLLAPPKGPNQGTRIVNAATYLGGGRDFGVFPSPGNSVHIISRNLTPDKTGLAIGGDTLAQFMTTVRTGADPDLVHPSCDTTHTTNCMSPPFNGAVLQVMPWPTIQNMSDRQLTAIYNYLSSIPCLEGGPNEPAHRCS
jgi:hypothetical protein